MTDTTKQTSKTKSSNQQDPSVLRNCAMDFSIRVSSDNRARSVSDIITDAREIEKFLKEI